MFVSKGCGGRLLGPGRDGRNRRYDGFVSRGVDASSVPAGRAETVETMGSSQGGVDASSVPAGRVESDLVASAASGTGQGNGEDPPAVLSWRAAHELSSWGRLSATVRGRTRGQSKRLEETPAEEQFSLNPEVADALLAAAHEWTKSGSMLKRASWTTEDAMAMMAGGPAAGENKGELSVRIPSGFPEDVEPPPQSVADVERSQYKAERTVVGRITGRDW